MIKIIEYEVGRYNGHPVVIRFANVSEEDAQEYAWRFAKRLQGEFGAFYPAAQNTEEMASWLENELGEMGVGLSSSQQDLLRTLVAESSPRLKQWMAKSAASAVAQAIGVSEEKIGRSHYQKMEDDEAELRDRRRGRELPC